MPKYKFKCSCGEEFFDIVKIGSEQAECKCGEKARKIFHAPNPTARFKGDHFSKGY